MCGSIEISTCAICKQENVPVTRKYYKYNIDCECCGGAAKDYHFEIVNHCSNCKPTPPFRINAIVKPLND